IAVRMSSAACQADYRVARSNILPIYDFRLLHGANGESCQVIFSGWIHARHFRSFPSDEGATSLLATESNTFDHLRGSCNIKFSAGEVIQKEQRFGTLHQNIVYAHRDQVNANRIMPVEVKCQFEFGTDAVGAGH